MKIPDHLRPSVSCPQCGQWLERTVSGYYSCPVGHGKLLTTACLAQRVVDALKKAPRCRLTVPTVLGRLHRQEWRSTQHDAQIKDKKAPGTPIQPDLPGVGLECDCAS